MLNGGILKHAFYKLESVCIVLKVITLNVEFSNSWHHGILSLVLLRPSLEWLSEKQDFKNVNIEKEEGG